MNFKARLDAGLFSCLRVGRCVVKPEVPSTKRPLNALTAWFDFHRRSTAMPVVPRGGPAVNHAIDQAIEVRRGACGSCLGVRRGRTDRGPAGAGNTERRPNPHALVQKELGRT